MAVDLNFKVKNGLVVATTATILGTTASNNTLTGALVVSGGVGIGQDLNVGGRATVSNNTNTLSTTTGALVVTGGVGIGQDLRVGGVIYANISGTLTGNAATVSTLQRTTNAIHYITFVDSDNVSSTAENIYTTSTLTINPSTGNVGLGTTTPGTRLDVAGNIRLSGTNPVIELNNSGPKIYSTLSNVLSFATGGSISAPTEAMQLNQWGTLALGTTPSEFSGYTTFQTKGVSLASSVNIYGFLTSNAYYDGGIWKRYTTGPVTQYAFGGDTGDHRWTSATTGTTATSVSLGMRMVLDVNGTLLLNRTTAQGVTPAKLQLSGAGSLPAGGTVTRANTMGIYINDNTGGVNSGNGIWFDHGDFISGIAGSRANPLVHGGTDLRFYTHPSDVLNISSTYERMRIGPEGNIGIGVIPSDTNTQFRAIEIGSLGNGLIGGVGADITILSANSYITATNLASAYATNGNASQFRLNADSSFSWHQAVSGTAGNAITFTNPMTLDTNGNLGIGVTPTTKLDVAGTARISGITSLTSTTNATSTTTGALVVTGGVGIGRDLYVGGTIFGNISGGGSTVQTIERNTNAAHFLTFVDSNNITATAESVYTTSSFVINPSTGNVGIGTASPVTRLDIAGGTRITGITTITNSTAATSPTTGALQVSGGVGINGSLWVENSIIAKGGEIALRDDTTASIVLASLQQQGNTVVFEFGRTDIANFPAIDFKSSGASIDYDTRIQSNGGSTSTVGQGRLDLLANQVFLNSTQTATSTQTGALRVTGGVGIGGNLYVGGEIVANKLTIQLTTVTTTLVETDDIIRTLNTTNSISTVTGALVVAGGVGIGGNVNIGNTLTFSMTPVQTAINLNNNDIVGVNQLTFADPGPNEGINFNSNFQIFESPDDLVTNSGGNLQFVVNGVRRVTFNSNGQVVITTTTNATSTTTGALVVTGGVGIGQDLRVGGTIFGNFSGAVTGAATQVNTIERTTNASHFLTFVDTNNVSAAAESIYTTSSFVINPSTGNIGIGTTSPASRLHVTGGTDSNPTITIGTLNSNTGNPQLQFYGGTGGNNNGAVIKYTKTATIDRLGFIDGSGNEQVVILNGGNVGIGTTTTSVKLEISGSSAVTRVSGTSGSVPQLQLSSAGIVNWSLRSNNDSSSDFTIYQDSIQRAKIASNGFVGIGTSNPSTHLDVFGSARIGYNTTASSNVLLDVTAGNSTQTSVIDFGYWAIGGFDASIWKIGRTGSGSSVDNFSIDFTASGFVQNRFIIDGSGNIGIGTTSTANRLNVAGGSVSITTTTNATSTTTGALIVAGGVGIGQDLRVGGTIYGNISGGGTTVQTVGRTTNANHFLTFVDSNNTSATAESVYTTSSFTINPGNGEIDILSTVNSTSTTTGALVISGGLGVGRDVWVNGSLNATTKSFVINHPSKPGKKLRYGSLEGPENGVYIRGRLKNNNVIELPEYWTKLVDPESITVNLTPIGKHQNLYVENIENNQVIIGNSNLFSKNIDCFYTVFAERQDVDKLSVEF